MVPLEDALHAYYRLSPSEPLPGGFFSGLDEMTVFVAFRALSMRERFWDIFNWTIGSERMPLLHYAISLGWNEFALFLVRRGANILAQDAEGMTLFMWACKMGYESLAEVLLHKKADVNLRRKDGRTALEIVILEEGLPEITKLSILVLLFAHGAAPSPLCKFLSDEVKSRLMGAFYNRQSTSVEKKDVLRLRLLQNYFFDENKTLPESVFENFDVKAIRHAINDLSDDCPYLDVYNWTSQSCAEPLYMKVAADRISRIVYSLPASWIGGGGPLRKVVKKVANTLLRLWNHIPCGVFIFFQPKNYAVIGVATPHIIPLLMVLKHGRHLILTVIDAAILARGTFKSVSMAAQIDLCADNPVWERKVCKRFPYVPPKIGENDSYQTVMYGNRLQAFLEWQEVAGVSYITTPVIRFGCRDALYLENYGGVATEFRFLGLCEQLEIMAKVLKILRKVHLLRYCHGDINSANILIDSGNVSLTDWDGAVPIGAVYQPMDKQCKHLSKARRGGVILEECDIISVILLFKPCSGPKKKEERRESVRAFFMRKGSETASKTEKKVYFSMASLFARIYENSKQYKKPDYRYPLAGTLYSVIKGYLRYLKTEDARWLPVINLFPFMGRRDLVLPPRPSEYPLEICAQELRL
ncbi:MAG: hypothetical protein A3F09_03515 [Chlamydiae bacterium RIFCSPHIGHO2_12_FULL_49_11]|nr:MAG: hypothetical protein A3F09_03515 [Chlamydiae bacterium RIFCSPHIGHO2_12_FULL_49_11]